MSPDEARALIDQIRPANASGKSSLLLKFKNRIAAVENLRLVAVIGGVIGALVAAISRAIAGDLGLGIAVSGAVMAAVCGIMIALMDRKKLELSQEATDAHANGDQALDLAGSLADQLEATQAAVEGFDRKRRERLTAIQRMIEVVEASLVTNSGNVPKTAEGMLRNAVQSIRSAVEYKGVDFFTITIFQKVAGSGEEVMRRIAAEWTNPELALKGGRSWKLGSGYTGMAWQNALHNPNGDVVIGDTAEPLIRTQYPVDPYDPERECLYRSVAAIPILVDSGNEVWGVVTATTDRPNVFVRDRENIKVQNVEMVRDIARIAALLAGLNPRKVD